MGISNIISLMGGLGMFLFGMKYMGDGLELVAGARMKDMLEKLTSNRFIGFLLGMLVTVVIQSSSATTVMVMGFINADIMNLAQATGVIFGANIGTTITSILIALDVSGIAPVCICAGAVLMLYSKRKSRKYLGQVVLGFGLLFQGLHLMSSSMSSLRTFEPFTNFIAQANNPLLGFVIGVLLCAILQSSSASVGVLQALSMQGVMPLGFAAFIVCGINVGSSTPVLLASLNAKNNAKRAALIYLIFNVLGSLLFIPLTLLTPITGAIESLIPSGAFQISAYHIMFKVVTGVILLPLINLVVKLTYKAIPKQAHESEFRLVYIDPNFDGAPAVTALQVNKEIDRMATIVRENCVDATNALIRSDGTNVARIHEREQVVDYLAGAITEYISHINTNQFPEVVSQQLSRAFNAINDLEQVGDHAVKICVQCERMLERKDSYSEAARAELQHIADLDGELMDQAMTHYMSGDVTVEFWQSIRQMERRIMELIAQSQKNHVERMQGGGCSLERGLTFMESLNSLQRMVNHASNIVESYISNDIRNLADS